jgi:porin
MVLAVSSVGQAESLHPQESLVTRIAPLSPEQQPRRSGFEEKATGDWGGQRQWLQQAGITIDASIVLEGFKNFCGGLHTVPLVAASTFDLSLTVDTEKLFKLPGGKFYADLEDHAGRNPSKVLVGDLQIFDKQNTIPYLQVFELWYQQQLLDKKLRLKVGKVDANTEFSVIDNGLPFLNSSCQVSPTIFLLPTTPDPMPSVNVFFSPVDFYYAGFGAYYANRSVGFGNLVGRPQEAQLSEFGTFLIGETGLQWHHLPVLQNAGNLKVGAWGHTGTFTRFNGSQQQGTYGYYAVLNQTLWQPAGEPEAGRGVRAFAIYGRTQGSISPIEQHGGGGITWTGLLASRPKDIVGFSPQYAHLSPEAGLPRAYELALETFYRLQITPWARVMADLQYIINPGGQYANALVGTVRLMLDF